MSVQTVRDYLATFGLGDRVMEFSSSSATVELAAQALGVEPARIAKTLSFHGRETATCLLLVTAGDARIDNARFRHFFGFKARMLAPEDALRLTGHAVGGVCPFALKDVEIEVYLDKSLKRFDIVYPAAGSASSAVRLTPEELLRCSHAKGFVDVCKGWQKDAEKPV